MRANVTSVVVFLFLVSGYAGAAPAPPQHPASVGSTKTAAMLVGCAGEPDGTPCDNADACTTNDRCWSGQCLAASEGSFAEPPGSPVAIATIPWYVVAGDVNHDGKPDLVVADHDNNGSGELTIQLGDGLGGFAQAPGSPVPVGSGPMAVVLADFNSDGNADLASANWYSGDVTILLGDGTGHFAPAPGSPNHVGTNPWALAVADFNRDGRPDLVVANQTQQYLSILLGDGSGRFNHAQGRWLVGQLLYAVVAADFNLDGKPDLAVSSSPGFVTIFLGDGTGRFAQGSQIPVGSNPQSIVVGDFDRDGNPDLAVASDGAQQVAVLLGNGTGGFTYAPGSPIAVSAYPEFIATDDFDRDGKLDLAITPSAAMVLLGDGTGRFAAAPGDSAATRWRMAVGDFNRDLRPDVALAGNADVRILLGSPALLDCDDHERCTADSCSPETGCGHTIIPPGGACDDGNACTTQDACTSELLCIGGPPLDCDDGNPCTTDACEPVGGCVHGDACEDHDPCTVDHCETGSGCVHAALAPPGEVSGLSFTFSKDVLRWDAVPNATAYDAVTGRLRDLPVGPGTGDETCLSPLIVQTQTALIDPFVGPFGGTYYVVRARNETCPGPWGSERRNVPGPPSFPARETTSCP